MAGDADPGCWNLFDSVDDAVNNFPVVCFNIRAVKVEQDQGVFFQNPVAFFLGLALLPLDELHRSLRRHFKGLAPEVRDFNVGCDRFGGAYRG